MVFKWLHPEEAEVAATSSFKIWCFHLVLLQFLLGKSCSKPGLAAATAFDPTSGRGFPVQPQFLIQFTGGGHHFWGTGGHDFAPSVQSVKVRSEEFPCGTEGIPLFVTAVTLAQNYKCKQNVSDISPVNRITFLFCMIEIKVWSSAIYFWGKKDENWRAAGFAASENEDSRGKKDFNSVPLKAGLCIKWLFYFLGAFLVSEKECLFLVAVYSILIIIKKKA